MRKFRIALIVFAFIIIIIQLIVADFSDLSWSNNTGSYLGIISMLCLIVAMISSNRNEKKHN